MNYLDRFKPEKINSIPAVRQSLKILKNAIDGREIGNYPPEGGVKFEDLTEELQHSLPKYVETTHSELKSLRDNSQLIPGCWYRITDYECTTIQENTKSAGHPFDILVFATSVNTLSEEAKAIQSERDKELKSIYSRSIGEDFIRYPDGDCDFEGEHYYAFKHFYYDPDTYDIYCYTKSLTEIPTNDTSYLGFGSISDYCELKDAINVVSFADCEEVITSYTGLYFSNSNLNAWKIWYCLDNDTSRFKWAYNGVYPAYISTPDILDGEHLEFQGIIYINGNLELNYGTSEQSIRYEGGDDSYDSGFVFRDINNDESFVRKSINYIRSAVEDNDAGIGMLCERVIDNALGVSSENVSEESIVDEGKGVIYRMIDEWNNDCPYDFKNIQCEFYKDWKGLSGTFLYTFSVIDGATSTVFDSTVDIKRIISGIPPKHNVIKSLNDENSFNWTFFLTYNGTTFGSTSNNNVIGEECTNIILINYCSYNTFGKGCDEISLYDGVSNVFDDNCYNISLSVVNDDLELSFIFCHFYPQCNNIDCDASNEYKHLTFLPVSDIDLVELAPDDFSWIGRTSDDDVRVWNPADPSGT